MQSRLLEQKIQLQSYIDNDVFTHLGFSSLELDTTNLISDFDVNKPQKMIEHFYQNILYIRVYIDAIQGIQTFFQTGSKDQRHWIRVVDSDAILTANSNQEVISICNYLRIFFSYLLSSLTIATICEFNTTSFREMLIHVNSNVCNTLWQSKLQMSPKAAFDMLAEGKGYLVNILEMFCADEMLLKFHDELEKLPINKMAMINRLLDQTKNWVALEYPSYSIYTILLPSEKTLNHTFALIDYPCCQLTDVQISFFNEMDTQLWYTELSSFEKQLILHYRDRIISGLYVIPSQLRSIIPLAKNAYLQSMWIVDEVGNLNLVNSYYHTGAPAHLSHKDEKTALMITENNLLQQKFISNVDFNLMICLNSSWADTFVGSYEYIMGHLYKPDDSKIISLVTQSACALKESGIRSAKICINELRTIERNDYSGIYDFIKMMEENYELINDQNLQYLYFKNIIHKLSCTVNSFALLDLSVKGLDIIHELSLAVSINNALAVEMPELSLKQMSLWFGCASGENRTGIVYYHNISSSFIYYLEQHAGILPNNVRDIIFKLIAKSQHLHVMTGNQGSAFGTEGVRRKSSGALRTNQADLVKPEADLKTLPANNSSLTFQCEQLQKIIDILIQKKRATVLLPSINLIINKSKLYLRDVFVLTTEEMINFRKFIEILGQFSNANCDHNHAQKLKQFLELICEEKVSANYSKMFSELLPTFKDLLGVLRNQLTLNTSAGLDNQGLFHEKVQESSTVFTFVSRFLSF